MSRIPAAYAVDLGYPLYLVMRMRLVFHENTPGVGKIGFRNAVPVPRQERPGRFLSEFVNR